MSNIIKKSLSVVLILTMLFSVFAINSSASLVEEEYPLMPYWSVIDGVGTSLSICISSSISAGVFASTHLVQP